MFFLQNYQITNKSKLLCFLWVKMMSWSEVRVEVHKNSKSFVDIVTGDMDDFVVWVDLFVFIQAFNFTF